MVWIFLNSLFAVFAFLLIVFLAFSNYFLCVWVAFDELLAFFFARFDVFSAFFFDVANTFFDVFAMLNVLLFVCRMFLFMSFVIVAAFSSLKVAAKGAAGKEC